jgi:hypothetical protein
MKPTLPMSGRFFSHTKLGFGECIARWAIMYSVFGRPRLTHPLVSILGLVLHARQVSAFGPHDFLIFV